MADTYHSEERRVQAALEWYREHPGAKISDAVRAVPCDYQKLRRRINGISSKLGNQNNAKLTDTEDSTVCQTVDRWDSLGIRANRSIVTGTMQTVLSKRPAPPTTPPKKSKYNPKIGSHLVKRWSERHPEYIQKKQKPLSALRNRITPEIIQDHFKKLERAIREYGVALEDIYNFDETGFQIGCGGEQQVYTHISNKHKTLYMADPENRQHLTSIECIGAGGVVLHPTIICKGKVVMESDFPPDLCNFYRICCSETGYSNDEIQYSWIQDFDAQTAKYCKGDWRMLIFDGYGSHVSYEVIEYCWDNLIVPFQLPAHSTHLLQPLDVTCFQPLKHYHREAIDMAVRAGDSKFSRREFLAAFKTMRQQAFKTSTLRHAFRDTGITPINPQLIINKLPHDELEPDLQQFFDSSESDAFDISESEQEWDTTPRSSKDLRAHAEWLQAQAVKHELPQTFQVALDKLIKAATIHAQNYEVIDEELTRVLEKTSQRQKRERLSQKRVLKAGIITVGMARHLISGRFENENRPRKVNRATQVRARKALKDLVIVAKGMQINLCHANGSFRASSGMHGNILYPIAPEEENFHWT